MATLFEKAKMGPMTVPNRIVKSATSENMAETTGAPTEDTIRFYERMAKGGTGLIVVGMVYVSEQGRAFVKQSGIHNDSLIPAWRKLTDAVHKHGSKIAIQLVHAGRQIDPKLFGGRRAVGPSPSFVMSYLSFSRGMTKDEISQAVADFGDAARRAKKAGFDAVQIHAAHGYLISEFLSRLTNWRRDEYGGSEDKRFRFLEEVYRSVRSAVGSDIPVLAKLNISDFVPGGITPKSSIPTAKRLAALGLDAIEMSGGTIAESPLDMCRGEAPMDILRAMYGPFMVFNMKVYMAMTSFRTKFSENYYLPMVEKLKPELTIPLILLGGIRRRSFAEEAVATGKADFISMARPIIHEPDLANKWKSGSQEEAKCISCNRCLIEFSVGSKLKCYRIK